MSQDHPPSFYCPISRQVMHDPVVLSDGHSYERRHIERWLECKKTSPVTGALLNNNVMFPNHSLRNSIEEYFKSVMDDHHKAIHTAARGSSLSNINSNIDLQRTIDSLMETSVLVNADMSSEVVLRRIIDEAKQLIGAEVASVFLVDNANNQLYSTINSTGGEIRIPKSAGIAGHVATAGEALIILDAYTDSRFNQSVDRETGFVTRNILCVPITNKKGNVIGVAQLINKEAGGALQIDSASAEEQFTSNDQRFLEVFASQAASAIANSGGSFEPERALHSAKSIREGCSDGKATSAADKPLLFSSFPDREDDEEDLSLCKSSKGGGSKEGSGGIGTPGSTPGSARSVSTSSSLAPVEPPLPVEPASARSVSTSSSIVPVEPPSSAQEGSGERTPGSARSVSTSSSLSPVEPPLPVIAVPGDSTVSQVNKLLEDAFGSSFVTDVLKLEELTEGKPLSTLAEYLFTRNNLFKKFNLDETKFHNFITEIENGYAASNAYHNKAHAASVLHLCHAIMKHGNVATIAGEGQWFGPYKSPSADATVYTDEEPQVGDFELLASLFAAIIHDYEHPGVNNQFLVRSLDPRSMIFNNTHVNEQHHVSAAYQVLMQPACNFMEASLISKDVFIAFRQLVIDLVIGTDMDLNKNIITQLEQSVQQARKMQGETASLSSFVFKPSSKADALVAMQMALKAADLGHLALPWDSHFTWVSHLQNEFFTQGDKERELGFDNISFLMDREKPGVMQSQIGFFSFVVIPLFKTLHDAFPGVATMKKMVDENFDQWKLLDAQEKECT